MGKKLEPESLDPTTPPDFQAFIMVTTNFHPHSLLSHQNTMLGNIENQGGEAIINMKGEMLEETRAAGNKTRFAEIFAKKFNNLCSDGN